MVSQACACSVATPRTKFRVCPCLGSLAASRLYTLSLAWRFWFVLVLWPGHRPLARSLVAASRLHVRPRFAEAFRNFACLAICSEFYSGGYLSPASELGADGTLG